MHTEQATPKITKYKITDIQNTKHKQNYQNYKNTRQTTTKQHKYAIIINTHKILPVQKYAKQKYKNTQNKNYKNTPTYKYIIIQTTKQAQQQKIHQTINTKRNKSKKHIEQYALHK